MSSENEKHDGEPLAGPNTLGEPRACVAIPWERDKGKKTLFYLRRYLDLCHITSENIGALRASLLDPTATAWNAWVRDETAKRELAFPKAAPELAPRASLTATVVMGAHGLTPAEMEPLLKTGICAECGEPIARIGNGWLHQTNRAHYDHVARAKGEVVETGYVGAAPGLPGATGIPGPVSISGALAQAAGVPEGTPGVFVPAPQIHRSARCPHCSHFGPVDHECSHETCQNCGMDVNEPPVVDPPDAARQAKLEKAHAIEVEYDICQACGERTPPLRSGLCLVCGKPRGESRVSGTLLVGPSSASWIHGSICACGQEKPAGAVSCARCDTITLKMSGPEHARRKLGPDEIIQAGDTGAFAAGESEVSAAMVGDEAKFYDPIEFFRYESAPGAECAKCKALGRPRCVCGEEAEIDPPGTDMRELAFGEIMAESDCLSDGEAIPSEWVGKGVQARGVFRGVPLGEPPGEEGPAGVAAERLPASAVIASGDLSPNSAGELDSVPGCWIGSPVGVSEVYRPALAPKVVGALRFAKCEKCGTIIYEKGDHWFHAGDIPNPPHAGVPCGQIFDSPEPLTSHDHSGVMAPPWRSNWEKLMLWLFPPLYVETPAAPAHWKDVIHLNAVTSFSLVDRVRILLTGRVHTRAIIVCENEVGQTKVASGSRPLALEGRHL